MNATIFLTGYTQTTKQQPTICCKVKGCGAKKRIPTPIPEVAAIVIKNAGFVLDGDGYLCREHAKLQEATAPGGDSVRQ